MNNIKILDKETINKIAAGEVIERPFSVVKELMENSIDAGSDQITIEVRDGGKAFIRVIDNGSGMSREDALISYHKHTTSKLVDLFNINTLGFRGEALSSIAAISNLVLKTNNGDGGIKVEIEAGQLIKEKEIGMNKGTIVEVSDLFFNTPVRKNYMKSREIEFSKIQDIVIRYALSNKNISFKLIHDDKEILNIPKTDHLLNKIVDIYGIELAKNLMELNFEDNIKVKGYAAKPYITKADKSFQTLFINGRYVKSETVSKAIYDAYHTLLFLDRHPVTILYVEMDFTKTDVNVHPTKDIIRIENEEELYESVFNALRDTFKKNNLVPEVNVDLNIDRKVKQNYDFSNERQQILDVENANSVKSDSYIKESEEEYIPNKLGKIKPLAQLNKTYILAENEKGLLIIDQHAMEERVNFELLLNQYKNKNVEVQKLLNPLMLELPQQDFENVKGYLPMLNEMGFEIEEYGDKTFIIRTIPQIITLKDKDSIMDFLLDLDNFEKLTQDKIDDMIASRACRKSIKAGDELSIVDMNVLIRKVGVCEDPYSCPHGRPTMINITLGELEKKFKRTAN
ncbi:DNA mismatch repair endonuclease MutL [Candidatus Woesearchaeota archaeon]|nr:DNA mismatch repair endonuclease MutL [Candidatus Woesearchaeota archaeon]